MTSYAELSRRQALLAGAGVGVALAAGMVPAATLAQVSSAMPQLDTAEADRIVAEFLNGATPITEGLALDLPALGDNPAAVPVRVHVTEPITAESWCEELILITERNPMPLACRFRFTQDAGSADVAVRLRLIQTMPVRALARMNDGRVLAVQHEITVAAGGCGL